MNDCCLAEFMEYRGQYLQGLYGDLIDCKCVNCRRLRERGELLKGRQAEDVTKNNLSHNKKF